MAISKPQEYGELLLQFTTEFVEAYNDRGTHTGQDGSFWTPVPSDGCYILGSLGRGTYNDPNGKKWALCVRQAVFESNALTHPVDWVNVWDSRGAEKSMKGSCWAPVPRPGYVALGHLFVKGFDKPPLTAVVCVREDLTAPGEIGSAIWNDQKSGAHHDISVWAVDVPRDGSDRICFIAPNTIVGTSNYDRPAASDAANVLALPFVSMAKPITNYPTLTSTSTPSTTTDAEVDHSVLIPFMAVEDSKYDLAWKITHSPFYTVRRSVRFESALFVRNDFEIPQMASDRIDTGVSKTQSDEFSITTGITVTYESGVSAGVASTTVSASLSIELGYKTARSVTVLQSRSVGVEMTVPPRHVGALWNATFEISVHRANDTRVGRELPFKPSGAMFILQQFPPPTDPANKATYTTRLIEIK